METTEKVQVSVDYRKQVLKVGARTFPIDRLEHFILKYWPSLAVANRIKAIQVGEELRFSYDWNKIFKIAIDGGIILMEFLEQEQSLKDNKSANRFEGLR